MAWIGHILVRFVQIAFAIALAALAAAVFLSIGYVRDIAGPWFGEIAGERADSILIAAFALLGAPFVLAEIFLPAALAAAFAEAARLRGLIANLLLGSMVALFVGWRHFGGVGTLQPSRGALLVLLAAGFIAGFAYWLGAGRSAGRWLDRRAKPRG